MSKIALQGNISGTGVLTIAAPNTNSDRTLTLPDSSGTLQVSGAAISGTTGTFTGLVDISAASAGQIKFPASQNASSDANTLDDYEEGTWTPELKNTSSSSTWSQRSGLYTRIGRFVICQFVVDGGNSGTAGSELALSGLPFNFGGASNSCTLTGCGGNGFPANISITSRQQVSTNSFILYTSNGGSITNQITFCSGTVVYVQ